MKSGIRISLLAAAIAAAPALVAAPPHAHDHAHEHASAPTSEAAQQRWETDEALRSGMRDVRAALDDLRHHEMGHMPAQMASERAGDIAKAVERIFAECKLAPAADADLHAILVPLLGAAKRLEQDSTDLKAIAAMRDAVATYPQRFDDQAWTAAPENEG